MKRVVFLYALVFICLIAERAALGQAEAKSNGKSEIKKACPFSIVGLWRSDVTTQTNYFFDFSSEGYITLLGHTPGMLPQDFEMVDSVNYKLDKPAAPKSIEFTVTRGNDALPQGITRLDIVQYGDDKFTTRDPASGLKTQWFREQTRRYFLTFAARSGPLPQGGTVCAMWTVMDGRKTDIEALGIQLIKDEAGNPLPVFGTIPEALYNWIIEESDKDKKRDKDENPFMRLELTAAEFETTHTIYLQWDKQVQARALPQTDPYLNAMEFLQSVAESLNPCGEKVKLRALTPREREELVAKHKLPQFLLEYVSVMRKKNDELHVDNVVFPWGWRPMIQTGVQ
jgi:hypothetical protein